MVFFSVDDFVVFFSVDDEVRNCFFELMEFIMLYFEYFCMKNLFLLFFKYMKEKKFY